MTLETLAAIWFLLWAVLWTVYFMTDGYTLGTGMLTPLVTKNKAQRKQMQEVIGPFWGGNEVWLITAGGATFAAFSNVYAKMFSSLYEALILLLACLFFRAIALELMHKDDNPKWQNFCKWCFGICSLLIAILLGVAFSNFYLGLDLGPNGYEGNFFSLLGMYPILGGVLFALFFLASGALWVQLKAEGEICKRSQSYAKVATVATLAISAIYLVATFNAAPVMPTNYNNYPILYAVPVLVLVFGILAVLFTFKKKIGYAFTMVCLQIASFSAFGFIGMFPNMLISRIDPEAYSLTIYNSANSETTLMIMLIVALIFVPIVIAYQIWAYVLFRRKVTKENATGY